MPAASLAAARRDLDVRRRDRRQAQPGELDVDQVGERRLDRAFDPGRRNRARPAAGHGNGRNGRECAR